MERRTGILLICGFVLCLASPLCSGTTVAVNAVVSLIKMMQPDGTDNREEDASPEILENELRILEKQLSSTKQTSVSLVCRMLDTRCQLFIKYSNLDNKEKLLEHWNGAVTLISRYMLFTDPDSYDAVANFISYTVTVLEPESILLKHERKEVGRHTREIISLYKPVLNSIFRYDDASSYQYYELCELSIRLHEIADEKGSWTPTEEEQADLAGGFKRLQSFWPYRENEEFIGEILWEYYSALSTHYWISGNTELWRELNEKHLRYVLRMESAGFQDLESFKIANTLEAAGMAFETGRIDEAISVTDNIKLDGSWKEGDDSWHLLTPLFAMSCNSFWNSLVGETTASKILSEDILKQIEALPESDEVKRQVCYFLFETKYQLFTLSEKESTEQMDFAQQLDVMVSEIKSDETKRSNEILEQAQNYLVDSWKRKFITLENLRKQMQEIDELYDRKQLDEVTAQYVKVRAAIIADNSRDNVVAQIRRLDKSPISAYTSNLLFQSHMCDFLPEDDDVRKEYRQKLKARGISESAF